MSLYSDIVKQPYERDGNFWYEADFKSLSQMQLFMKSKPRTNQKVFSEEDLSSMNSRESFAGQPLDKAIEYLMTGYDKDYAEFLALRKDISQALDIRVPRRKVVKSYIGNRVHMANYVANKPKSMLRLESSPSKKIITVNFCIGYSSGNSISQIRNRGILTLNLIKMLEMNGYIVKLNAFKLNECGREMLYIKINLKNSGEILDEKKCYFPFCGVEFSRRILFRVLEVMPVTYSDWSDGYGRPVSASEARALLAIPDNDIVIGPPDDMGICGYDIYADANEFFEELNLDESIKVRKISKSK